jgi:hypothetical protein
MYPSSFEPLERGDYEHVEEIEQRHAESSWKTWVVVMLVILAFVLIFVIIGESNSVTSTTQVLPDTPAS